MAAWQEMSDEEERAIWESIADRSGWLPPDSRTYEIVLWDKAESNRRALEAFRSCMPSGGRMYALDWQHPCYWFYPHEPFDDWLISVLPDGDFHHFLSEDLTLGTLGHPWEPSLCVFGRRLLQALDPSQLSCLGRILRERGPDPNGLTPKG